MLNVGELATWVGWIMTIVGMLASLQNSKDISEIKEQLNPASKGDE